MVQKNSWIPVLILVLFAACSKKEIAVPDDMVLVPGGEALIGSNDFKTVKVKEQFKNISKPLYADEYPERKVFVETVLIDKYEVSNQKISRINRGHSYPAGGDNHPAVLVSWFDAASYCKAIGKRLPTEEEWEKAGRGADGKIFPWGNTFDKALGNTSRAGLKKFTPVGMFEEGKSVYGVYDMIGNVGEWTKSWYKVYPGSDYIHADFGNKLRVIRGSSWGGEGHYKMDAYDRLSFRRSADPGAKIPDVGFRCAR